MVVYFYVFDKHTHHAAVEQFFVQGPRNTEHHNEILLYVSLGERYVEIIADDGIHERVTDGFRDNTVAGLLKHVKAGQTMKDTSALLRL